VRRLTVLRAGAHTAHSGASVEFDEAAIAGMASTYDPAVHEAPLVVGHPTLDAPAYGWVRSLSADAGVLAAVPDQVAPAFAELVQAGRFKKISAAVYLPGSRSHPLGPDAAHPYLKHVGFLGATAPAVKGLRAVEFAAEVDGDVVEVEFADVDAPAWTVKTVLRLIRRFRDYLVDEKGVEVAEQIMPASEIDWALDDLAREEGRAYSSNPSSFAEPAPPADRTTPTTESMTPEQTAELAEREQTLTTRESEIQKREAALATEEATRQHAAHVEFAEGLADDNARILPRHVPVVAGVLDALRGVAADGATVAFGEGTGAEQLAPADALERMFAELPSHVEYSEVSRPDPEANRVATVEFAAPDGYSVDDARGRLHAKALAYQAQHKDVDYVTAVRAVGG